MYKVIRKEELKKINQYNWFRTFSNPCYGLDVKMDVTKILDFSKRTNTSFFINVLYIITQELNKIEEFRLREVNNEIRLYNEINPTFTVMTKNNIYENAGFKYIKEYKSFYNKTKTVIEEVKNIDKVKETYNDNNMFNDFYITCAPWIAMESMTHPLPNNNIESSSVPRICWDKYRLENDKYIFLLNITVSHCFIDGYPLSLAFNNIQEAFNNVDKILVNE